MAENIDSLTGVQDVSAFTYVVRDLPTQHLIDSLTYYGKIEFFRRKFEKCQKDSLLKENNHFEILSSEIGTLRKEKEQCQEKCDRLNEQINSYKNQNTTILNDSIITLNKKIDSLRSDSINPLMKKITELRDDSIKPLSSASSYCEQNHKIKDMARIFINNDGYVFGSLGVLLVLIIAITIIVLKRGLTFSKGNTSICLGEKKRTRTKKAD